MELLNTADAAELIGCSEDTLRKRRQRPGAHPPTIKVAGVVLYPRSALVAHLAAQGRP